MVDKKELLAIDPNKIRFLPETEISDSEVVAMGRGDYEGVAFVHVQNITCGLDEAREIAKGISRQGPLKGVVGPGINLPKSRIQEKVLYNHQSRGLWSEVKFIPHILREFQEWVNQEGNNG